MCGVRALYNSRERRCAMGAAGLRSMPSIRKSGYAQGEACVSAALSRMTPALFHRQSERGRKTSMKPVLTIAAVAVGPPRRGDGVALEPRTYRTLARG